MSLINSLNTYFDHIYVVTLRRATERHAFINEALKGIQFQLFYGADNQDFTIQELTHNGTYDPVKAAHIHRYNKVMTAPQLGCSLSHKLVYEDVIQHNYAKVLILEDDSFLLNNTINNVAAIMQQLPVTWELLYLDYMYNEATTPSTVIKQYIYYIQHSLGLLKWNNKMIRNLFATKINTHISKAGFHEYTNAYAITQAAAAKLITLQTPIAYIADNLLAHAITNELIEGYICHPKVFAQQSQLNHNVIKYI